MESIIKTIYENYRNSFGDLKPESEGMKKEFDNFTNEIDMITLKASCYDSIYDGAVSYAMECQEFGFMTGFKMAMNIMRECSV